MSKNPRVFRPLGLTLAILAAIVAFSVYPIAKTYFAYRLNDCTNDAGFACGISSFPFDTLTQAIGVLGVVVFITAIFAWWGKPPQIRFIFQGAVLLTAIMLMLESIVRVLDANTDLSEGQLFKDSTEELFNSVLRCQIPMLILVALYIIWYCNRAPARAFYTQKPIQTLKDSQQENEHE